MPGPPRPDSVGPWGKLSLLLCSHSHDIHSLSNYRWQVLCWALEAGRVGGVAGMGVGGVLGQWLSSWSGRKSTNGAFQNPIFTPTRSWHPCTGWSGQWIWGTCVSKNLSQVPLSFLIPTTTTTVQHFTRTAPFLPEPLKLVISEATLSKILWFIH